MLREFALDDEHLAAPAEGAAAADGVDVDAEFLRVLGVERVLCVDEGGDATRALRVRDCVQSERRLAR